MACGPDQGIYQAGRSARSHMSNYVKKYLINRGIEGTARRPGYTGFTSKWGIDDVSVTACEQTGVTLVWLAAQTSVCRARDPPP